MGAYRPIINLMSCCSSLTVFVIKADTLMGRERTQMQHTQAGRLSVKYCICRADRRQAGSRQDPLSGEDAESIAGHRTGRGDNRNQSGKHGNQSGKCWRN